jgi:hypothetical protein
MDIGKIFQWVFMEKSARKTLEKRRKAKTKLNPDGAPPHKSQTASKATNRDELKESALSLLRDRRGEFEALDQDVQDRVAKAAEKALNRNKKKQT